MEATAYKPHVRELASRIYVNLVEQSMAITDSGVKMTASAENLAKLSFQLAEAFQGVEDSLNADNMPKNQGYQLNVTDISGWSK
jgi:hypothetical protein